MKTHHWKFDASRLKALREMKGLSADEFGRPIGKTGPSILNWESGRSVPSVKDLIAMANVYQIDPSAFLHREPAVNNKGRS